ncbi:MAG: coenzyme F420-0:L-glutamate ligase, partial [Thermoprotei archaeon]
MTAKYCVYGLTGIPEVSAGDDLATLLVDASKRVGADIADYDVIVVAQKIVSKAEGRLVKLTDVKPSQRALRLSEICGKDPRFVELVLRESSEIVVAKPGHLIATTKRGVTCANAGIDVSNVAGSTENVLLLPEDPDASARSIRLRVKSITGKKVGVIISDTHGRTLREGQVNVAIGASGLNVFRDYRGVPDSKGYVLRIKQISVAD